MYRCKVTRHVEAAHHNGPEGSKCYTNHGHSWFVEVLFEYNSLNEFGWGPDFHQIKKVIDRYDHQDLNTLLGANPPSAEMFAQSLWYDLEGATKFSPVYVMVRESDDNTVYYSPSSASLP